MGHNAFSAGKATDEQRCFSANKRAAGNFLQANPNAAGCEPREDTIIISFTARGWHELLFHQGDYCGINLWSGCLVLLSVQPSIGQRGLRVPALDNNRKGITTMWGVLSASLFFLPFNQLVAWLILLASVGMGIYHHIITPTGLGILAGFAVLIGLKLRYRQPSALSIALEAILVIGAIALFCHLLPGFNNPVMIDGQPGPLSASFKLYYNFDKALLPFLLFACLPTLFNAAQADKNATPVAWLLLILSIPVLLLLAVGLGGLKIELHAPEWILAFLMANLFFVAMAEEALFRGYLQQRLRQWLGAYPALIITALAFGAAHLAGGMLLVGFATLAGLIYGLAWMWSGRLWVPILFHFGLNVIHLLFFTYPHYLHA